MYMFTLIVLLLTGSNKQDFCETDLNSAERL